MANSDWFKFTPIGEGVTLIREPFVHPLLSCNIWHVAGRDLDLMIDTGLGIGDLHAAAHHLFGKRVAAVATHSHVDHIGGHHQFAERWAHPLEAEGLADPQSEGTLFAPGEDLLASVGRKAGVTVDGPLLTQLPYPKFRLPDWELKAAKATRLLSDGEIIDLGDRHLEVLHLPGHSPGGIGLWDARAAVLFSGDAVYDGGLIDSFPHSDQRAYVRTMERLLSLPVDVVHAGHDESFGRERLKELARNYLERASA